MTLTPHAKPLTPEDAAHFLRRTSFGATEAQIRALVGKSAREVAEKALDFPAAPAADNPFDPAQGATPGAATQLLRAGWLHELLTTAHPLREKLALTWSGHFVVATDKVRNIPALLDYLALLRRHAATPDFARFTLEVAQSPAMLRYLDNDQNRRGKPNENFSRELLELFTTGIGHYSEEDVREGARALSGWTFEGGRGNQRYLEPQRFVFLPKQHDDGQKTYLGVRGALKPEDVVRLAATHPQTAVYVSRKLWRSFVADTPDERGVQASAETWRRTGGNVRAVLEELLSSAEFYTARQTIIRGPVEFLAGAVRGLDLRLDEKQTLNLARTAGRMGQLLLEPDTVKGWDGGREWINDTTLLTRMQVAAALTLSNTAPKAPQPPSPLALLGQDAPALTTALRGLNPRQQAYLMLVSPEFQLA